MAGLGRVTYGESHMYYIVRGDGKYVAKSGARFSYTLDPKLIRTYKNKQEAETDLCFQNERGVTTLPDTRP